VVCSTEQSRTPIRSENMQLLDVNCSIGETLDTSRVESRIPREPVCQAISLLDAAANQLQPAELEAHCMIVEAVSLLRGATAPRAPQRCTHHEKGRFTAWQARRILRYIQDNVTGPVRVADLSAVLQLSNAHFSRSFRRTFGESPHALLIRRRLELAAQHMVQADGTLSEIALLCGFADQAHLSRHFRQAFGQTPAAWRRARRAATALDHRRAGTVAARTYSPTRPKAQASDASSNAPSLGPRL
jgi:AraC family transcriptional regulator